MNKIIDSHMHLVGYDNNFEKFINVPKEILQNNNLEAINLLAITGYGEEYFGQNVICATTKLTSDKIYAFGGLSYDYEKNNKLEQVKKLLEIGFDGIKIIESKPSIRIHKNFGLNNQIFDDMFDYLEKNQIPITWHVGDPSYFWESDKVSEDIKARGWYYGDSEIKEEQIYSEALEVLKKHPKLKVSFAHMFFSTKNISQLETILSAYQNIYVDITPGFEMYRDFSNSKTKWISFFEKFQDRVIFGTDNGSGEGNSVPPEQKIIRGINRIDNIYRFFSTEESVVLKDGIEFPGIILNHEIMEKLFAKNAIDFLGEKPEKINIDLLIEYANSILKEVQNNEYSKQLKDCINFISKNKENYERRY